MSNAGLNETNSSYGATEAAAAAGISLRQLYYWERLGLLRPKARRCGERLFRRYSERDLARLRRVKRLLDDGYRLQAAISRAAGAAQEEEPCGPRR